ncbi:MAG: DEAD/DEAH box helicase [Candidatus Nanoarchaeia archaeon]
MKFKELELTDQLLKCIDKQGFTEPTEIQEKTIPHILEGKDVIAESATGSGKTLAFGAGMIPNITKGKGIQGLVLTPTRELAEQVKSALEEYSRNQLKVTAIYGGVSMEPQYHNLKKADIVVGTPGRLLDHLQRRTINLSRVSQLVLDEADRMLDMGFLEDVEKIMSQCPQKKQTMFFSATIPPEIMNLSKKFMESPELVRVDNYVDPKKLSQFYYDVPSGLKFSLLVHLIREEEDGLVMVFCNSRRSVDFVAEGLQQVGIDALGIHGGLTQQRRSHIMEKFNSKSKLVLVCTDVAARGLDVPNVSHVYNYDIPNDSKQYIHRIGRTARAGKSGKAINLLSERDHDNFGKILNEFDVNIEKLDKPYVNRLEMKENRPRGFGKGQGRRAGPKRGGPRQKGGSHQGAPRQKRRQR